VIIPQKVVLSQVFTRRPLIFWAGVRESGNTMRITVKAKPNSYEEKIEKIGDTEFVVSVKEPPVNGLANKAILKALREYFHTSNIRIISGHTSRQKIVEIL